MTPAWKKDRRVPVADPGRTERRGCCCWKRRNDGGGRRVGGVRGGGTGDTEGTCYALRDMAEARGIHNFVKTKMLRSCLGGVAFFLVSRNVQARLSLRSSSLGPFPSLGPLSLQPPPSPSARLFLLSCSFPLLRSPGALLVRVTSAYHPFLVSPVMRRGMRNVL